MKKRKNRRGFWQSILFLCCMSIMSMGFAITVRADNGYVLESFSAQVRYGEKLSQAAELSGIVKDASGATAEGSFKWKEPEKLMDAVGTSAETVIFTPVSDTTVHIEFTVQIEVKKGRLRVVWPIVTQTETPLYYGDVLSDTTVIGSTGSASFIIQTSQIQEIPVSGVFEWEDPQQQLETGLSKYRLIFVPADQSLYENAVTEVTLEVRPIPVELKLTLSESKIKEGEEVTLTARAENLAKLSQLKGSVTFYVDGEALPDTAAFTKKDGAYTAAASFIPDKPGNYRIQAEFMPEDSTKVAEARSDQLNLTVYKALSSITTSELPDAVVGREYEAELRTDAAGQFPVTFEIRSGSLPDGLTLDPDTGIIKGKPEKAETAAFTVAATEGSDSVTRKLTIRVSAAEKLAFSIVCDDISYGERVSVQVLTARNSDVKYKCYYTGRDSTVYDETSNAPSKPGKYRVKAEIEEPAEYAGQEVFTDFTIEKAKPRLTVTASPEKITGGGEVKLSVKLSNPHRSGLTEGLPDRLSVSFDRNTATKGSLTGKDGEYSLIMVAKNADGKVRCTVSSSENELYFAAEAHVDVTTSKKAEDSKKPSDDKKKDDKKKDDKKKEEEPPVKTKEEVEAEFWQDVVFRIYKAQEDGSTVTINAKGHGKLPETVMEALRTHNKVTLALVWEGDMIVIPAGKAPAADRKKDSRTLAELSKSYPLTKPSTVVTPPAQTVKPTSPTSPNTGGTTAPTGSGGVSKSDPVKKEPAQSASGSDRTDRQEESSEAPEESEPDVTQTDTEETPEPETGETFSSSAETENDTEESYGKSATGLKIDWFVIAAVLCTLAGVAAVTTAVIMIIKKRNR